MVAQLLTLMDGLTGRGQVIVIAATNLLNSIDPALRRGGRFDREIEIGIPDKKGRLEIFQVHTRGVPLDKDINLEDLAETTFGFVGADIALLVKEAAMNAIRNIIPLIDINKEIPSEIIQQLKLTKNDFDSARKIVLPSALREVRIEIPDVPWENIAGLDEIKDTLIKIIEGRATFPQILRKIKLHPPKRDFALSTTGDRKDPACQRYCQQEAHQFYIHKRSGTALQGCWGFMRNMCVKPSKKHGSRHPASYFLMRSIQCFPKEGQLTIQRMLPRA